VTFTDPPAEELGEPPTVAEERSWLRSTAFWAVLGGVSSLLTGLTTLGVVVVAVWQLHESRELTLRDEAYASWNEFTQATLSNPEFACPDTADKFAKLMQTPDPKSLTGATYRDRYAVYGALMITTAEQVLKIAPDDPYWKFRIEERIRCNGPAIGYLMHEGTYEKRYSCRLRHVIAEALGETQPTCTDE
jgi:hypothetical protein